MKRRKSQRGWNELRAKAIDMSWTQRASKEELEHAIINAKNRKKGGRKKERRSKTSKASEKWGIPLRTFKRRRNNQERTIIRAII